MLFKNRLAEPGQIKVVTVHADSIVVSLRDGTDRVYIYAPEREKERVDDNGNGRSHHLLIILSWCYNCALGGVL